MIKCRIWWDDATQGYVVSSSYSPKLVEGLKNVIPSSDRLWDDKTKFWHVTEAYGEMIRKVAEVALGPGTVSFTSKQVSQQYTQSQNQRQSLQANAQNIDACIAEFFGFLSYEVARKSYLLTAQTLHPDKATGNPQKMSRLNELWSRIEKDFFKR